MMFKTKMAIVSYSVGFIMQFVICYTFNQKVSTAICQGLLVVLIVWLLNRYRDRNTVQRFHRLLGEPMATSASEKLAKFWISRTSPSDILMVVEKSHNIFALDAIATAIGQALREDPNYGKKEFIKALTILAIRPQHREGFSVNSNRIGVKIAALDAMADSKMFEFCPVLRRVIDDPEAFPAVKETAKEALDSFPDDT